MEIIKMNKRNRVEAVQIPLDGNINLVEVSKWLGGKNGIKMENVMPGYYIIKDYTFDSGSVDIITKEELDKRYIKMNDNGCVANKHVGVGYIPIAELLSEMIDHYRDLYDVPRPRLDLYYRKIEDYIKGHDDIKNSDHWKRLWEDVKEEVEGKRNIYSSLYSKAPNNIR